MSVEILTVSNSQIDVWDRCEFRWYLNYGLELVPNRKMQTHFQVGTFSHSLLEVHYEARKNGIKDTYPLVVKYAQTVKFDGDDLAQLTAFKRSLRIVERYIREYAPKHDNFRVLATERHFVVELVTPKGRPYRIQGYFDMLIEMDGKLWIVDHKTTGSGTFWSVKKLLKDSQMTTYILGLREQGYNVFGCVVNQLNTYDYAKFEQEPMEKLFRRERVYRTDAQIKNLAKTISKVVDEMYDKQESGEYRKSNRYDCDKCPYFTPCLYDDKGMSMAPELAASFRKRDPRPTQIEEEPVEEW